MCDGSEIQSQWPMTTRAGGHKVPASQRCSTTYIRTLLHVRIKEVGRYDFLLTMHCASNQLVMASRSGHEEASSFNMPRLFSPTMQQRQEIPKRLIQRAALASPPFCVFCVFCVYFYESFHLAYHVACLFFRDVISYDLVIFICLARISICIGSLPRLFHQPPPLLEGAHAHEPNAESTWQS